MFPNQIRDIGVSAAEVRDRLTRLHLERAFALGTELAEVRSFMADLDEEIEATRQLYVVTGRNRDRDTPRRALRGCTTDEQPV